MASEATLTRERLPPDRRISAIHNAEDFVFLLENALKTGGGKNKEGLKLAEMEQTHNRVDICARKEDPSEG